MGVPALLQFSIPLFTGMVAATFIPPVRKAIPRPLEILLWAAFVGVCTAGVTGVKDANARELTSSVVWGGDQIINSAVGVMIGGLAGWVSDHRFVMGSGLVIVAGTDIFVLMLLDSHRRAQPWQPRVRLREWMEFPIPAPGRTLSYRQLEPDPLVIVNQRLRTWTAMAAFAAFAKSIEISLWIRDVVLPRGTQRLERASVGSRAGLASVRDAGEHLRFAAWSWFVGAWQPLLDGTLKTLAGLNAESIDGYGPLSAGPTPAWGERDGAESQRSDRLAS